MILFILFFLNRFKVNEKLKRLFNNLFILCSHHCTSNKQLIKIKQMKSPRQIDKNNFPFGKNWFYTLTNLLDISIVFPFRATDKLWIALTCIPLHVKIWTSFENSLFLNALYGLWRFAWISQSNRIAYSKQWHHFKTTWSCQINLFIAASGIVDLTNDLWRKVNFVHMFTWY